MSKIKKYEKFLLDEKLMSNVITTDVKVDQILRDKYKKLYFNQLLMEDVVNNRMNENKVDIINKISSGDWNNNVDNFIESIGVSKRSEFLSTYTIEELESFKLFKLEGYNIGFALKEDDIILVHNNEEIGGIGKLLINKAAQFGGSKLEHFDGFLTGFYKSLGFNLYSNDFFADEYAPGNWKYQFFDITNPNESIYVNELSVSDEEYKRATIRYESGRPDVVYRSIKVFNIK